MDKLQQLAQIHEKVERRQYRLTGHAERERESDKIAVQEIEEALSSNKAEVIENYPEDVRGRSCLIMGFTKGEKPLHIVCGLGQDYLIIITVYRPDQKQWINWRHRRREKL